MGVLNCFLMTCVAVSRVGGEQLKWMSNLFTTECLYYSAKVYLRNLGGILAKIKQNFPILVRSAEKVESVTRKQLRG